MCDGRPGLSLRHWMLDVPLERIALTAVSTGMLLERRAREVCACVTARAFVCAAAVPINNRHATKPAAPPHVPLQHSTPITRKSSLLQLPYPSTVGVWAARPSAAQVYGPQPRFQLPLTLGAAAGLARPLLRVGFLTSDLYRFPGHPVSE